MNAKERIELNLKARAEAQEVVAQAPRLVFGREDNTKIDPFPSMGKAWTVELMPNWNEAGVEINQKLEAWPTFVVKTHRAMTVPETRSLIETLNELLGDLK